MRYHRLHQPDDDIAILQQHEVERNVNLLWEAIGKLSTSTAPTSTVYGRPQYVPSGSPSSPTITTFSWGDTFDMDGARVVNGAPGVNSTDLVTMSQLNAVANASGPWTRTSAGFVHPSNTGDWVGVGTTDPGTAFDLVGAATQRATAAPSVSPADQARWHYDSASGCLMLSENGGAYTRWYTGGTVTSVAVTPPSYIVALGSPVTTSGTIYLSWTHTISQNSVFAGPASGGSGYPLFRTLGLDDVPSLSAHFAAEDRANNLVVASPVSGRANGPLTVRALVAADIPALSYISSTTARAANTVLAGPSSGADSAPTFRSLSSSDIPALAYATASGTSGKLAKFTGTSSLGDSVVSESGSEVTIADRLALKETTAPTSTSGYAKYYVKSSDSKPYVMDDSGVEWLGWGGNKIGDYSVYGCHAGNTGSSGVGDTAYGVNSMAAVSTSGNNSFFGCNAGYSISSGYHNVGIGFDAMRLSATAVGCVAVGGIALRYNTVSSNNAIGYASLYYNTTGTYNCAGGRESQYCNTDGICNTSWGHKSLYGARTVVNTLGAVTGGSGYVNGTYTPVTMTLSSGTAMFTYPTATIVVSGGAVTTVTILTSGIGATTSTVLTAPNSSLGGTGSGFSVPVDTVATGSFNTAIGYYSLYSLTTAQNCVAVGVEALCSGTTCTASTSVGAKSLRSCTSGQHNVALGYQALYSLTANHYNVALGSYSLYTNNGTGSVAIGRLSGGYETGSNKLFIDALDRSDEAGGRTKSLIYGEMATLPASQLVSANAILQAQIYGSATNTAQTVLRLRHDSSGTPTTGYGVSMLSQLQSSTTIDQDASAIVTKWSDATHATRTAYTDHQVVTSSAALASRLRVADTCRIGDVAGSNYTQFHADGTMEAVGTATCYEDVRIEPVARSSGGNVPTFEKCLDDAGGTSRGVYAYAFSDEIAGQEKELHFAFQMPHGARLTAPISPHVHWFGNNADTTASPRWGLEYAWSDIGSDYGDTTTVYTASGNVTPAGTETDVVAGRHYLSEFADITPSAAQDNLSSVLIGRLFRDSADAGDTYNVAGNKCYLLYIDFHVEMCRLGSRSEYAN